MTRSASTRRRMFRSNTIVPAPQERPPVWVSIILTRVAAVVSWAFVGCAAWWLL